MFHFFVCGFVVSYMLLYAALSLARGYMARWSSKKQFFCSCLKANGKGECS
jgi:hypothetical protein